MLWGLDLALRHTGLVVLDSEGEVSYATTIRPGAKSKGAERWAQIIQEIAALLESWRPELVVIEGLGFNSHTLALSAELSGIVRYYLYLQSIEYKLVPPTTLKKLISSKGNCKKEELAEAIFKKYGKRFSDSHQADAFALARLQFEGLI